MSRNLLSIALLGTLAHPAAAVLSLKITSPTDQSFALAQNDSAKVYGTITGVEGDISSWSFSGDGLSGSPLGATFMVANDGTTGTLGFYLAQNTTADFTGLLGTITATGAPGRSFTNILSVFDSSAKESDGENLEVRISNVQPTPEPSCVAAFGLGGLALLRRRRALH